MLQLIMSINRQRYWFLLIIFALFTVAQTPSRAFAQEDPTRTDIDESFDPFTDYNEYDQQTDEEQDINFLKNGRYLTIALITGYRGFIAGGFSQAYTGNINYGAEFSYFFNMQSAVTLSYLAGDHGVNFNSYNDPGFTSRATSYSGTVNIQVADLLFKYYVNTDNVTKGLADLNPYLLGGGSYFIRTYKLDSVAEVDPDRVWGLKLGGGIEIPILKREAYLGIQAAYRYVQFPDENKDFIKEDNTGVPAADNKRIKPKLNGDIFDINFILGFSF